MLEGIGRFLGIFVQGHLLQMLGLHVRKLYYFFLDKPMPKPAKKKDYYDRMADTEGFVDTLIGFATLIALTLMMLFFTTSL